VEEEEQGEKGGGRGLGKIYADDFHETADQIFSKFDKKIFKI